MDEESWENPNLFFPKKSLVYQPNNLREEFFEINNKFSLCSSLVRLGLLLFK